MTDKSTGFRVCIDAEKSLLCLAIPYYQRVGLSQQNSIWGCL